VSDHVTYEGRDLEVLADMPRYYAWIMEDFRPHLRGRVAEIGAGVGTVSRRILPHVETLDLVEPSANLVGTLRDNFDADRRVTVYSQTLERFIADHAEPTYDAIVMVNVLEHIADDADALRGLWRQLLPGGKLLVFVPALSFLFSPLDEMAGHYRRYSRTGLEAAIQGAGFQLRKLKFMDLLGIAPWYVVNKLLRKTSFSPSTLRIYDTFGIPATRLAESILGSPIGKNLIAIAEKPLEPNPPGG
jgi:SAM-dependent methyltransferase